MGRLRMRSGSYPRQQTPPPEPSRSMWRALFILLPIAPALILLPAIAFASPPDPSWIAGIYDGADGDDIVSLVYETLAAKTAAPSHVGPLPACRKYLSRAWSAALLATVSLVALGRLLSGVLWSSLLCSIPCPLLHWALNRPSPSC